MNRAVDGDVVAVEVFPESEWVSSGGGEVVMDEEGVFLFILPSSSSLLLWCSVIATLR